MMLKLDPSPKGVSGVGYQCVGGGGYSQLNTAQLRVLVSDHQLTSCDLTYPAQIPSGVTGTLDRENSNTLSPVSKEAKKYISGETGEGSDKDN